MTFSAWGHVAATYSLNHLSTDIYSAERILLVDIAMEAGVYTSRSDKLEDFNAVEYMYMNSL